MTVIKNKLVIIDGNAIIHRAYHALPPLTTKEGTIVNAVYGFASILLKVLQELKPTHLVATFDLAGSTFRDDVYKEYKATRVKADQELYDQIPLVHELVRAFDIPIFEVPSFEADDVIGTLAKKTNDTTDVIIVTGDMDALQLVDEKTSVFTLKKGITDTLTYTAKEVKDRYGLTPEQIVDYKALKGDPSDNIPGVKGIGEKGATELLQMFGSLKKVLDAATGGDERIAVGMRKKLCDGVNDARMSETLARIRTDVPLQFSLRDAAMATTDWKKVAAMFARFEFTSLIKRLPREALPGMSEEKTKKWKGAKTAVTVVRTKSDIDALLRRAHTAPVIGMQLLPDGADRITAGISAAILCVDHDGFIVPFDRCDKTQKDAIINLLQTDTIVGHDVKQLFLRTADVAGAKLFDVMVASYLLDPGSRAHDAATVIVKRLGIQLDAGQREGLFGADYEHAARELIAITSLYPDLKNELEKTGVLALFLDIEMPLVPVLARMEKHGVKIDTKALASLSKKLAERIEKITKRIHTLAGESFNIASSTQLREILYTKLKLPTFSVKKGKTGLSTAAMELEKLHTLHPIIPLIEEYRELAKLQNTYVDALPALINKTTGRIHTTFNQTVAATGRLSSSDPNLQNIPMRTELGHEIRHAFIAEKGTILVTCDYSQIELRIAAHLAHDEKMIAAFAAGQDIHAATAAAIHHVPVSEVTKEMRHVAKTINFGILFGMGAFGMAARTGLSQYEAKEFIDRYFAAFTGIKRYMDDTIAFAKKHGFVETLFGRRRYIPELKASNLQLRNAGERMAINHPVQGTEADIIKKAMIEIDEKIRREWPDDAKMLLQVHDELVFEVTEKRAKEIAPRLQEIMQDVVRLDVPIDVSVGIGKNWGEAK
ncbi:DNA polymerase I [Candidatus Uhrbacteria bacterium RIFCSPLOWO2_02_FULL_51_9]|uniref:DNA polymerase I n=1 Tax=Candidatus Uhrbacteria bacterium RIFCSPLOWO2_02_FULL_51_9 TaxID=1802410 RepID=A0A1F7VGY2_9BACT|nr:MAG: DNA polymerase I [Candidatus Uhrbacteria bacterium RIFCSPLOWO2_02_FULL_51_9]